MRIENLSLSGMLINMVQKTSACVRPFRCGEAFRVLLALKLPQRLQYSLVQCETCRFAIFRFQKVNYLFKSNHCTNHSNSKKNINRKRSRWSWWSSTKGAGLNLSWSMVVRAGHSHRQTSFSQPIENFPACLFKSSLRCFVIVRLLDVGIEDAIDG